MKTLKQLREMIQEAKQVGTIYHFTKPTNLKNLMDDEYQKSKGGKGAWHMTSQNGYISATRNHELSRQILPKHHQLDLEHGYSARITLDGDKISERHKIGPVKGLRNDNTDILNHRHNDRNRVSRHTGEREEAIHTDKDEFLNICPYIKRVDFVYNDHPTDPMNDEEYKHIAKHLDAHGISHSLSRKWNNEGKIKVNEACDYDEELGISIVPKP